MSTAPVETQLVPVAKPGAADATAAIVPQFARGFEGMATEPFPEAARKVLAEAVNPEDVEIKPDGIVFLPGVAYRRILTRAFGAGGWAIAPRSPARVMGNIVVYHGALFALGRFVAEAVGECFYRENNPNMSYASCVEGAKTDALGRCCKDLGIAAELWDANWREKWKAKYAVSYRGKKWDGKKGVEVDTTLWKLKERVSNPHDLMAGAGGGPSDGGNAPSAKGPDTSTAPTANPASEPVSVPAPADTGEPATDAQKAALKLQVKSLGWKGEYLKIWIAQTFGLQVKDARQAFDGFSVKNADAAFALLTYHGKPNYAEVLARLKAEGSL